MGRGTWVWVRIMELSQLVEIRASLWAQHLGFVLLCRVKFFLNRGDSFI